MLVSATSSNAILGGQQLAQAVDVSIACALNYADILTMRSHFMSVMPICIGRSCKYWVLPHAGTLSVHACMSGTAAGF